jgi:Tfp pilus assembly protein PilN
MQLSGSVNKFDRPSGEIRPSLFKRWNNNLINCLPRWLRRLLGAEQAELIIDTSGIYWQATLQRYSNIVSKLENLEDDLTKLKDILYRAQRLAAKIILLIPEREVLVRNIRFPTDTPERFRKTLTYTAVGYELDRLTPFSPQDVYHEFRFLPTPSSSYLEIELAIVRKTVVDENLRLLREAGCTVDAVSWHMAWAEANLLPFKQRRKVKNFKRKLRSLLIFIILGLSSAIAMAPLIQKRFVAIDLSQQSEQARKVAAKVNDLRSLIEQEQKTANFLIEQKRAANYTVDLLLKLTDLIPDTAWVNMLNYHNGQVDFSGEAQQASALIELLAKHSTFRNSTFRSPTTRTSSGLDRFHIQFDYVGNEEQN